MELAFASSFYLPMGKRFVDKIKPYSLLTVGRNVSPYKLYPCSAIIANQPTQVSYLLPLLSYIFF